MPCRSPREIRIKQSSNYIGESFMPFHLWPNTTFHRPRLESEVVANSWTVGTIFVGQNTIITHLPIELILHIIGYVDHKSLRNLTLLNKQFRQIVNPRLFQAVKLKRCCGNFHEEPPTAIYYYAHSMNYVASWCSALGTFPSQVNSLHVDLS